MRRSSILAYLARQDRHVPPPDRNPWVEAMARTLTGVVGWVMIIFALGIGGALGDALATAWHGPANTVWPIYASIGGVIAAGLAAQIMLFMMRLTDRRRIHYVVLLVGLIPGVGLVALIFAGTNWLVTRELDRRERDESNAPDQTT
jgi:hypothetical protein